MLNKLKKSNNESGFTIIEVMIVLAIAGLIILIVLLAVPALQRNGRNTAIKNDASAIAGGVSEFASNNDGKAANASGMFSANGSTLTIGASTDTQSTAKIQAGTTITYNTSVSSAGTPTPGTIVIVPKKDCKDNDSTRAVAVVYSVEISGGKKQACLDS